jgi:hypothetical protein
MCLGNTHFIYTLCDVFACDTNHFHVFLIVLPLPVCKHLLDIDCLIREIPKIKYMSIICLVKRMRSSGAYIVQFSGNYSTYLHIHDFTLLCFFVVWICLLLKSSVPASYVRYTYLPTHSPFPSQSPHPNVLPFLSPLTFYTFPSPLLFTFYVWCYIDGVQSCLKVCTRNTVSCALSPQIFYFPSQLFP